MKVLGICFEVYKNYRIRFPANMILEFCFLIAKLPRWYGSFRVTSRAYRILGNEIQLGAWP